MESLHNLHTERLMLCVVVSLSIGCAWGPGCRQASTKKGPPTVILQGLKNADIRVQVEVVFRQEDLRRGLMFRNRLGEKAGMLFVYPEDGDRSFWMKNTYIPLDMIFIGNNQRIVGIIENAQPQTTQRRAVDADSRYVLEANGGFTQKYGIRSGGPVQFENIKQITP